MVAQNNFELQVYVARTAAELQQGGGTRLKEVPGPNAEPGTSYVQARPAGEFFALKVMNNLPAYKMAQWAKNPCVLVKVDGKQATVTLPSVKSGPTTFCGWEVDAYDKSRIKPFQFADTPLGEEGQTTAQIAAANPGLGSFTVEAFPVVVCTPYTAIAKVASHTSVKLREGKAAKKCSSSTMAPSQAEMGVQKRETTFSKRADFSSPLAKLTVKYRSPVGLVAEGIAPPTLHQPELEDVESESEEEIKVGVKRAGPSNVKAEPSAKKKAAADEDDVIDLT